MSFVFWWGSDSESVSRGIVVDVCLNCSELRPFVVADHFKRDHLYSLTISSTYMGTTRVCAFCNSHFEFIAERYACVLPMKAAETLSIDEGVARCLPGLAETLALVRKLDRVHESPAYRAPDVAHVRELLPMAKVLLALLAQQGYEVLDIARRLMRWQEMSEGELREAVAELKGLARGAGIDPTRYDYAPRGAAG